MMNNHEHKKLIALTVGRCLPELFHSNMDDHPVTEESIARAKAAAQAERDEVNKKLAPTHYVCQNGEIKRLTR